MKFIFTFLLLSLSSFSLLAKHDAVNSHEQAMAEMAKTMKSTDDVIDIAVLVYDDVVIQDFAGPMEVFSKARKLTHDQYNIFTVGLNSSTVATENAMVKIVPDYSITSMPKADYLIIPGASMPVINKMMHNQHLAAFISKWSKQANVTTVSICTGAYLLANTGILQNKQATTHYFVADDFAGKFPTIDLIKNVRFVDDGNIITSSGVTSGIDAALYIVSKNNGDALQAMIARALQYQYHEKETWPVAAHGMKYQR